MTQRLFDRALSRLLLLPIIALALFAGILAQQIHSLQSSATWVDHSDLVIARMNELTRLMVDEETGIRGYLLTGREEFLEPYHKADRELDSRFRELQQLVKDNPAQIERLRRLSADNVAWEEIASRQMQVGRTHEQLISDSLQGKAGMDQIRADAAQFIAEEGALRTSRSSHALFRSRTTYLLLAALVALVATLVSVFTRRTFRMLSRLYESKVAEIQAEREWLNTTLRGIGDGVIACSPDGNVVFMNPVAEKLTGWAEAEARGHRMAEVFPIVNEDTRAIVESPVDKVLRLGTIVGLANHTVLVRRDHSEIAIDDSGAPIRDAKGSLIGVVMVFRDVSERRAQDRAIQRSEAESRAQAAELRAIMEVVPALLFVAHDRKCERVTCSRLAYDFVRMPQGANISNLAHPYPFKVMRGGRELGPEEMPLFMAASTGQESRDFEATLVFSDGTSRDEVGSAIPLYDEHGKVRGAVAAFIEITERKRAEEALRKAEKLAVAGRLAASISHEINNPLAAVTNAVFLVQTASTLEKVREFAAIAQEELARVIAVTTQTLHFYRQASRPTAVVVSKLLDSVLALYERRFAASGITIERQYDGSAPLRAHDGELRQIFTSLVANAFDATRKSGMKVIVRERQSVDFRTGSRGIRITVADSGHGMDRDTLKRIFEPFFSTRGDTGTGLGLWVAKELIEKHSGCVRVRSSQGPQKHGAVFSIFFPFPPEDGKDTAER